MSASHYRFHVLEMRYFPAVVSRWREATGFIATRCRMIRHQKGDVGVLLLEQVEEENHGLTQTHPFCLGVWEDLYGLHSTYTRKGWLFLEEQHQLAGLCASRHQWRSRSSACAICRLAVDVLNGAATEGLASLNLLLLSILSVFFWCKDWQVGNFHGIIGIALKISCLWVAKNLGELLTSYTGPSLKATGKPASNLWGQ